MQLVFACRYKQLKLFVGTLYISGTSPNPFHQRNSATPASNPFIAPKPTQQEYRAAKGSQPNPNKLQKPSYTLGPQKCPPLAPTPSGRRHSIATSSQEVHRRKHSKKKERCLGGDIPVLVQKSLTHPVNILPYSTTVEDYDHITSPAASTVHPTMPPKLHKNNSIEVESMLKETTPAPHNSAPKIPSPADPRNCPCPMEVKGGPQ